MAEQAAAHVDETASCRPEKKAAVCLCGQDGSGAKSTPREIAKQLTILQSCFVEAHEQQLRDLQQLLVSTATPEGNGAANGHRGAPKSVAPLPVASESPRLAAAHAPGTQLASRGTDDGDHDTVKAYAYELRRIVTRNSLFKTPSGGNNGFRNNRSMRPTTTDGMMSGKASAKFSPQRSNDKDEMRRRKSVALAGADRSPSRHRSTSLDVQELMGRKSTCKTDSKEMWVDQALTAPKTRRSDADENLNVVIAAIEPGFRHKSRYSGRDVPVEVTKGYLARYTTFMVRLTEHVYFELFFGFLICLNAAVLSYEAEYVLTAPIGAPLPAWVDTIDRMFACCFVLELFTRMCAGLVRFFCTCNPWNYFDVGIVTLTFVEEFFQQNASLSNTRMVRLLRITRLAKFLRMLRIVRVVSALRILVNSLMGTIRQVLWAFCLIACLIFVFGVIFGQVVGYSRGEHWELTEPLTQYWGTVPRCMYTLFMSVTGGVSWGEAAGPLEEIGTLVLLGFLWYVAVIQWVVLMVITGCFCESAAEASRRDVSLAVQEYRTDRDRFLHQCKAIFRAIDMDGTGQVQMGDLRRYLDSEPARVLFSALEVDIGDAYSLFELLDEDGNELVDLEEFMWGCLQLKGGASALRLAQMQLTLKKITKLLCAVGEVVNDYLLPLDEEEEEQEEEEEEDDIDLQGVSESCEVEGDEKRMDGHGLHDSIKEDNMRATFSVL
eukprot:TRINITY_DN4181_c1_g2_i1.p1 TRINITY_DN4181_c1_g2~~TRINITY_DN4181_c1_g2_i1.p1  ORF type:complete len:718 (+),score=107.28 TRINITY_DN4181_c1_g2_i1:110-2263(+)